MTYIPGVGATLKTGRSIAGPTWAGGAPVPPTKRQRPGLGAMPQFPTLPNGSMPAPMTGPPMPMPGMSGGRRSRGSQFGFAPDDGQRIKTNTPASMGVAPFGGLNEFYANQEGTPGNRTNAAFFNGTENNDQPWTSPEIAGALNEKNMELVPFAGQIIPVPKRDQGSPGIDPAGMPIAVRRNGEVRVNADGSVTPLAQGVQVPQQAGVVLTPEQQVTIAQAPGQVIPTKDLTMLSDQWAVDKQTANDARLAQSGITDFGGGFKTLANKYGTGVAIPAMAPAPLRGFQDERGMLEPLPGGGFAPIPDPLAGTDWGTLNGIQSGDRRPVQDYIAAEARMMPSGAAQRRGNDLIGLQQAEAFGLAQQIGQNLKDRTAAGLPMMAPQPMVTPGPASPRPATTGNVPSSTPKVPSGNVPLAQLAGLPSFAGLPMAAMRGAQQFLRSPQAQQMIGQQMLTQALTPPEDNTPRFVPLQGTSYGMAFAGNRPMGTLPMQQQTQDPNANLLADVERAQSPLTLQTIMQRSNDPGVIKAARARLDKMQTAGPVEDYVFRMDPVTGKVDQQKWVKGKKPPPGYQRMEDENNDGVPDAMQPGAPGTTAPTPEAKSLIDGLFARRGGK